MVARKGADKRFLVRIRKKLVDESPSIRLAG
jgi:hypothetical protein